MVIISKKKYAFGDLVSTEMPFVHALDDEAKSKICDGCICSEKNKLKKCSGCKVMFYCSEECQKKDWTSGHKYECNVYKKYYYILQRQDSKCRLVLRLYFVLKNNKKLATQKTNFQCDDKPVKEVFENLKTFEEYYEKDNNLMEMFAYFLQLYDECKIEFDQSTMFELFCKCVNNSEAFIVNTVGPMVAGISLYLSNPSFRRSSSPNVTLFVKKGFLTEYRAIKEINIGDELFIGSSILDEERTMVKKILEDRSIETDNRIMFFKHEKAYW